MVIEWSDRQDEVMTALMERTKPMSRTSTPRDSFAGGRDPAHELYDHAAGLLATAQALEAATHAPDAVAATTPTLACVETSLVALGDAVERLSRSTLQRLMTPVLTTE